MKSNKITLIALRIVMSSIFLWAFLDKLLGLGSATSSANAWIRGGSPTYGFLTHAVKGPFADIFKSLAGKPLIDWLFMLGLLFIGLTLLFNRYVRWGALAGALLMLLMYLALLWPENNPIVDEHIVYMLVLAFFAARSGRESAQS